jgi:hypothetical protein
MKTPQTDQVRIRGSVGLQAAAALGAFGLLAALTGAVSPLEWLPAATAPHMGPDETAAAVWKNAQLRTAMETLVIVFQVCGVTTLCLSRCLATSRWADRGRVWFVAAMVGLGAVGTLCAWFGSPFAMIAGGTMAVLLNIVILWTSPPARIDRRTALPEPYMAA